MTLLAMHWRHAAAGLATAFCFLASPFLSAEAEILVDLMPGDAIFDTDVNGYSGNAPNPNHNNGMTLNVTFTPAAGDLDSNTAAVNLIEVGGDANGTGIYMLGGEVHFLSKMNGGASNVLGPLDDLDFSSGNNMIGAKSTFGSLSAGTEYSVAAVYDPLGSGTLEFSILEDGQTLHTDFFNLAGVGTKNNWSGDDSFTVLQAVGGNGGGLKSAAGNPFSENLVNGNPFEGTQGRGLYWNQLGTFLDFAPVPEPASLAVWSTLLLGFAGLRRLRRRK